MPVAIRPLLVGDLDAVLAIETSSFTSPWPRDGFLRDIQLNPNAHCHAAVEGEELVGYIDYWVVGSEAQVATVAVHPQRRRRGIGEQLMRFALDDMAARGVGIVTLEVRVGNTHAQALYERLGFRPLGTRKRYYQDNHEDAVVMACDLKAR